MGNEEAEEYIDHNKTIHDSDSINPLGREILGTMEQTPLQPISLDLLNRQALDAGFEFNKIQKEDLPQLIKNLKEIVPRLMPVNIVDRVIEDIENVKEGLLTDKTL